MKPFALLRSEQRHSVTTIDEYFSFLGNQYPIGVNTTWTASDEEQIANDFGGYAKQLFKADPVVFAAARIRMQVFSQARFQYRRFEKGRPQELFGDRSLQILERPWPGGTTPNLLSRMSLHESLSGNSYILRDAGRLNVLRPDWVTIVLGSDREPDDPAAAEDAELVGFLYRPGGRKTGPTRLYLPSEVAHFAPQPDPEAHYRGMSWLTPVVREVQADKAATEHKWKFFRHGATPNMVVKFDPSVPLEMAKKFKEDLEDQHQGVSNAYKTMYLGGGADATPVGADFEQLDFSNTQGKGETRILMAAGVHPAVAGASEGMQGSSLNAGNYGQARRAFSDIVLQQLWAEASASLETIVDPPDSGARLWFDARDIPFLQDDLADTADIQNKQAGAIRQLVDGGFTPESVVSAIDADDYSLLVHTGNVSVQLQPAGSNGDEANSQDVRAVVD